MYTCTCIICNLSIKFLMPKEDHKCFFYKYYTFNHAADHSNKSTATWGHPYSSHITVALRTYLGSQNTTKLPSRNATFHYRMSDIIRRGLLYYTPLWLYLIFQWLKLIVKSIRFMYGVLVWYFFVFNFIIKSDINHSFTNAKEICDFEKKMKALSL